MVYNSGWKHFCNSGQNSMHTDCCSLKFLSKCILYHSLHIRLFHRHFPYRLRLSRTRDWKWAPSPVPGRLSADRLSRSKRHSCTDQSLHRWATSRSKSRTTLPQTRPWDSIPNCSRNRREFRYHLSHSAETRNAEEDQFGPNRSWLDDSNLRWTWTPVLDGEPSNCQSVHILTYGEHLCFHSCANRNPTFVRSALTVHWRC